MSLKECVCTECEGYHEGYCIMDDLYPGFNLNDCDCKSNSELMTEEEYDEVYDKYWVTEWDKTKLREKVFDAIEFIFVDIFYFIIKFHIIAVFAVVIGFIWIYYGIVVLNQTGIWAILSMFTGMFISAMGISYSARRLIN